MPHSRRHAACRLYPQFTQHYPKTPEITPKSKHFKHGVRLHSELSTHRSLSLTHRTRDVSSIARYGVRYTPAYTHRASSHAMLLASSRPRGYMSITPKTQVVEENGTEPQARVTHCIGRSTYTLSGTTAIRCALSPAKA